MILKTETKTMLLLLPQQLITDHLVLKSLHVHKSNGAIDYILNDLDRQQIAAFFNHLPKPAKDALTRFTHDYIQYSKTQIKKRYAIQKAGIAFEVYARNAMLRELYRSFELFKPYASLVKWYHRIKTSNGHFKTAPCSLSEFRAHLEFEVQVENDGFELVKYVNVNGTLYPLSQFNRYHFLLESNNEYFLLGYKEMQTLDWLQEHDKGQYSFQPQLLAQNILSRLEEDYPVNRNDFFEKNIIDVPPVNRVLLSEISGSFLVLTPQWLYEDFLIEGECKEKQEFVRSGTAYVVKRNKDAETGFKNYLLSLHPNFGRQLNGYYYLSFADAQKKQWFLKVYHQLLERDIQVIGMDMLQHFRYSPHKPETTTAIVDDKNGLITLKFSLRFGQELVPLPELQKMLLSGQKAILLKDGSLGIIGDEWLQQYGMLVRHGKIINKELQVARWMAISEENNKSDNEVLRPIFKDEWWQKWQQWQSMQENGAAVYAIPASINATLRPYQHKAFEWMMLLTEVGAGACLADDMGLGKTLQTICVLAQKIEVNTASKHLIVCPTSLIFNWMQELQKFAPSINTFVYHGVQRNSEDLLKNESNIIVTSYGTLRSDIEKLSEIYFDTAVIDESHNIKNPSALITRAVNQLNTGTRLALSGTPVMNNTFDLYSQLSFLLPNMFGSREFFKREYADAIDRDRDPEKIKALQKLTSPFILRRTKEQVAQDLPDKVESVLWCSMGSDQRAAYESIKEKVRSSVFIEIKEKGFESGKLSVINGLLKLRQVCNSCELVKDEDLFASDSIKTDLLVEELQNIIGSHKALVFSQFTAMLDLLETRFNKHHIPYCRLDGTTPVAQRQNIVNSFQEKDSRERVFLISLKAGNAGLNLTAADYVFLFDPWWNTAVQQQAIDRTHRIGQTKNVFAYKMICKGTIEEKIIQLQERKKKLSDQLIGEEEGFVKNLSEADIEFLFS